MASDTKQATQEQTAQTTMAERTSRRIVIPGGSGHVGELLAEHFHARGDKVTVLSRNPHQQPKRPWTVLPWDPAKDGDWIDALDGADACIHLSGRSVNTRATAKQRDEIYHSRIDTTSRLGAVMRRLRHAPPVWLNASTATIYRHSLDRAQDEFSGEEGGHEAGVPKSWAFSVKVGLDWEAALFEHAMPRTRRVALRTSLVMSPQPGSIFAVLSRLVRFGLGGTNGKGTQRVSWMHAEDYVRAVEMLLEDERWDGVVNLSAPEAPTNRDFMRTLRKAWGVRFGPPAPEWAIQIGTFLLRTEPELVLKSRWVYPGRLEREGFPFRYADWQSTATDLVRQMRATTEKRQG
ncbi:TIGR01777 family oxidoreductase [Terriglobus aquaticus]|uniref:TIGR01777 family oxidoreductase n=1 Tax=Terriglobus aquaticus TaxID=940139 RepID=A0ABW9KP21_9BACT|nr:TIGR01777 family oxidoreductase [Terriglobus aquaticus]